MHQSFYTLSSAPQARFPTVKTSPCHEAYIGPELMGPNAAEADKGPGYSSTFSKDPSPQTENRESPQKP